MVGARRREVARRVSAACMLLAAMRVFRGPAPTLANATLVPATSGFRARQSNDRPALKPTMLATVLLTDGMDENARMRAEVMAALPYSFRARVTMESEMPTASISTVSLLGVTAGARSLWMLNWTGEPGCDWLVGLMSAHIGKYSSGRSAKYASCS